MIVLVMGVSGAGKTAVGERLAQRLGFPFIDADDHHPAENVAKMAAGIPLDDADRAPWLGKLNALLRGERDAVLACSALKEKYRKALAEGVRDFRVIHLKGTFEVIHARLTARKHRYMPPTLLESQFAALEAPSGAIEVDVRGSVEECVERIVMALR